MKEKLEHFGGIEVPEGVTESELISAWEAITEFTATPEAQELGISAAELLTAAVAIWLLVKGSKMFSSEDPETQRKATRTITTGSVMLTTAAVLAENVRYAVPDLGILTANMVSLLRRKISKPEKINAQQKIELTVSTIASAVVFVGLHKFGYINTPEEGIVPAGLAMLGVSYALQAEGNKVLRRTLGVLGGATIVVGGVVDFVQAENLRGQIISLAYGSLNAYFTVMEVGNLVRDRLAAIKKSDPAA